MTATGARRGGAPAAARRPPRQLIEELVGAAVAAPSMHNTQPWRFRIRADDAIELRADATRLLPIGDPHGRAAHIACGAALLNLRIAAAAAGWHARARLLPDPGQPLLLAEIRLSHGHEATPSERELHAAVPRRQTNREPFSNQPVPPGIRADLAEAADAEGATLYFPGHNETVRILRLVADTERELVADPSYRDELARWVGGYRDREGIPDRALGPRSPEGSEPVRDFGRHLHPARYAWFEEHPQLAVLSVRSSRPVDWLAAGQALERVWLTATSRGISVSPLTQPLETADAWLVRDPQSRAGQPQMILRIGYGLPLAPGTRRRPLSDVIDERQPGGDAC
jgi:nitroreductase